MLTLTLVMALMVIFAAVIVPTIAFDIKRDREEEMIHRGVQYARAIRGYYKKFGRYPVKLEDLESSNNLRFLRKRYKDPENCKNGVCKDFVLLHYGDPQLAMGGLALGGGSIPGANPIGGNGPNGPGGPPGNALFGANSNSSFGQNQAATNTPAGTDASQPNSQNGADATGANGTGDANGTGNNNGTGSGTGGNSSGPGATFGGGPIVGVTSANKKDKTIREFNHKKKYNEWQFVYDPTTDRGGLIKGPYQPQITAFGQQGMPNLNGQQPGSSSPFSSSPSGMQNNSSSPSSGGFGAPNPPATNPPQQQ
ncbi:MAG TPA: hypothetical protein VGM18_18705 [Candidatus Sulfotelmatobacter sp.]